MGLLFQISLPSHPPMFSSSLASIPGRGVIDNLIYNIKTGVSFIEAIITAHPKIIHFHKWQTNLEEVMVIVVIGVMLIMTASREMGEKPDRVELD